MSTENETPKKQRGGARPGSGRKFLGETVLLNFRIPKELKEKITAESARRKVAGEDSLNAEFINWAKKKVAK